MKEKKIWDGSKMRTDGTILCEYYMSDRKHGYVKRKRRITHIVPMDEVRANSHYPWRLEDLSYNPELTVTDYLYFPKRDKRDEWDRGHLAKVFPLDFLVHNEQWPVFALFSRDDITAADILQYSRRMGYTQDKLAHYVLQYTRIPVMLEIFRTLKLPLEKLSPHYSFRSKEDLDYAIARDIFPLSIPSKYVAYSYADTFPIDTVRDYYPTKLFVYMNRNPGLHPYDIIERTSSGRIHSDVQSMVKDSSRVVPPEIIAAYPNLPWNMTVIEEENIWRE